MKKTLQKTLITVPLALSILLGQVTAFAAGPVNRDAVEEKYKWNIDEIYPTKELFDADYKKITDTYIPKMKNFKGQLTSAENIKDCLTTRDEMMRIMEKLYIYSHMKSNEDESNSANSEMSSLTDSLNSQVGVATAFIQTDILAQPEETIKQYMDNPILDDYKHSIDELLKQKLHTLSQGEEEILSAASDMASSPDDIYSKIKTDIDGFLPTIKDPDNKDFKITNSSYGTMMDNKNREFRKNGFEGLYGIYDKDKNSLAATLNAEVKKNEFFAKTRKYNSAMEASLASENIPVSVYDNLVKSVGNNVDSLHKYVSLRKKVLGVDKVHLYDMYVPLTKNFDVKIPYEDGKKLVLQGLAPLGQDYTDVLKNAFESRWADVYETNNKYSGAYEWGTYDTHPYVLMNYDDSADSVLTTAHEFGHAMNAYYTNKAQKYINSEQPIFTAEVASTTNELLMLRYLINNAKTDEEKLYYINTLAEDIRGTVYTQTMYAEFEKMIHERVEKGEGLSADSLSDMWKSLMLKYYGQDFQDDDLANLWWARIPHFYMNFYVYKYATSMAASNQLVKNMTEGTDESKADAIKKYRDFLASGSSDYPIETLEKAGVDVTTSDSIDSLLTEFDQLVDQMDELLSKEQ
ncbi:oligoendopeptidase F [Clostridium sp.]|uniref:oligoendopeptidase F n=1 Tax=Clostridium sp. TaxID=1506 RepID=UPI00284405B4|nr:oligoendopeptidase F [Clostridium sp.]MDR3594420.1 oligoendopeptidase F [Clostridium sp.]